MCLPCAIPTESFGCITEWYNVSPHCPNSRIIAAIFSRCLMNFLIFTVHLTKKHRSCDMTKPTKWVCAQRRLRSDWASTQSDQSSLCTQWVAKGPRFLHADSKDSDQTGRMPRLIWVFGGQTCHLLVLSWGDSLMKNPDQNDRGLCFWNEEFTMH